MHAPATFDPETRVIDFSITIAGREVPCHATEDWLEDACGRQAAGDGALEVFSTHRAKVDAAALRCWLGSQGAEPVWLKRDHVWRQTSGAGAHSQRLTL